MYTKAAPAFFLALLFGACARPGPGPIDLTDRACRSSDEVQWVLPDDAEERRELYPWCRAVGGPVLVSAPRQPNDTIADTLVVVSWNTAVGGADLDGFVQQLKAGAFTGGRVPRHFVLLLQEAHRASDRLPPMDAGMVAAGDAGPIATRRSDILTAPERLGLHLVYVPSMRSGNGSGGLQADRGNAILSTLPLDRILAIELPVQAQRRVAVSATVSGATRKGEPWRVQLTTVHLDRETSGAKNPERGRLNQTTQLVNALPAAPFAIVAGDINTWLRGEIEAAVIHLRRNFPNTPSRLPSGATYVRGAGTIRQYLDYMFFRRPGGGAILYRRVPQSFGSDHYPLVAEVPLK